jgi:hypothetical protein
MERPGGIEPPHPGIADQVPPANGERMMMAAHAGIEPASAAFEAPPPSQRMGQSVLVPRAGVEPCLTRLKGGAPHPKRNAAEDGGREANRTLLDGHVIPAHSQNATRPYPVRDSNPRMAACGAAALAAVRTGRENDRRRRGQVSCTM